MYKIKMPEGASYVIEQLNSHGYEAYIVGGCVRDSLLGKTPDDWDITTSASPQQVKSIFTRTVDTGIQHGTVTVLTYNSEGTLETYEVTTYRVDGKYEDHRRPKEVTFTSKLSDDLQRRDFTINAMAYNDEDGLIDIFGGREDLQNRIIRCVGNPDHRFDEDALRILRAVRFAAQLGFAIEENTCNAISKHAMDLTRISAERIQVELTKLICSDHPSELIKAYELGITAYILPEFDLMMKTEQNNPYHLYNVGIHTIKVMENTAPSKVQRYAALFHDMGKPECKVTDENGVDHFYNHPLKSADIARTVMRRLKLDNQTIKLTCLLVKYHDYGLGGNVKAKSFRRFLAELGVENFDAFLTIRIADMAGQSDYRLEERKKSIERFKALYEKVISQKQCLTIKELAVDGKDIMALGIKPGKQLGEILNALLSEVLDKPELNDREILLEKAKNIAGI